VLFADTFNRYFERENSTPRSGARRRGMRASLAES